MGCGHQKRLTAIRMNPVSKSSSGGLSFDQSGQGAGIDQGGPELLSESQWVFIFSASKVEIAIAELWTGRPEVHNGDFEVLKNV